LRLINADAGLQQATNKQCHPRRADGSEPRDEVSFAAPTRG
jgi:hypothetical protein